METKIHAVIVTFHPAGAFEERLARIVSQVSSVSIVDNSTEARAQTSLFELSQHYPTVSYIGGGVNRGLAAAQNIGIEEGLENDAQWILLLDDDSMVAEDMVEKQLAVAFSSAAPEKLAIVAPRMKNSNATEEERYLCRGGLLGIAERTITEKEPFEVQVVVASGSLIKSAVLRELGTMEEKLFIDEIDTEFCLRCIHAGYMIVVVPQAELYHRIGEGEEHRFFGVTVTTWNHSPLRKFYIYRNRIWLWKNYIFKTPAYVVYEILSTGKLTLLILLFEKGRRAKIAAMLKGVWRGLWL